MDTHGGNGNGTTCIVLRFDDDTVLKEMQSSALWKTFPPDETLQTLIYGTEDEDSEIGPFLNDGNGGPPVPGIRNGCYFSATAIRTGKRIFCSAVCSTLRLGCMIRTRICCSSADWIPEETKAVPADFRKMHTMGSKGPGHQRVRGLIGCGFCGRCLSCGVIAPYFSLPGKAAADDAPSESPDTGTPSQWKSAPDPAGPNRR